MSIFIAHAGADREAAEALEKALERRGQFVELDDGETALAPVRPSDAVVLILSARFAGAEPRLRLEQRALDAWAEGRLVLVSLDDAPPPVGLRDLPAVAAGGEAGWQDAAEAVAAVLTRPAPEAARQRKGLFSGLGARRGGALFVAFAPDNAAVVAPLVAAARRQARRAFTLGDADPFAAIRDAAGVVVMCSRAAFESDTVKRELYLADRFGKPLAPVLIEDAAAPEHFRYFLAGARMHNLFETPEPERPRALARLVSGAAA